MSSTHKIDLAIFRGGPYDAYIVHCSNLTICLPHPTDRVECVDYHGNKRMAYAECRYVATDEIQGDRRVFEYAPYADPRKPEPFLNPNEACFQPPKAES